MLLADGSDQALYRMMSKHGGAGQRMLRFAPRPLSDRYHPSAQPSVVSCGNDHQSVVFSLRLCEKLHRQESQLQVVVGSVEIRTER
jgi:hypothetical protein